MRKIFKRFLPVVLTFFALIQLQAQTPKSIQIDGTLSSPSNLRGLCNEAGTIEFGVHIGQSNDVDPDTIFLCFGDSLSIEHQGGTDFTGDPNPGTVPGIGYVFYDCRPTIDGPDLSTILTDPCINQTDPIIIQGLPVPQTNGIWVAAENPNGDITLFNDGSVQASFNGGVAQPTQFWFAPITIDDFFNLGFENDGLGGPVGPCVDVSVDQAFSVVYLNEIRIRDQNTNAGPTGCVGSFIVEGGLPEFDTLSFYNVDISLAANENVRGFFNSVPSNADTMTFTVPQPGIYNITIQDGKSCARTFTMDMSGCEAVNLNIPFINALPGENVCLDVSVANFNDVASLQFSMNWDPSILSYTNVQGFTSNLPDFSIDLFNDLDANNGNLSFSWADFSFVGASLPDGEVLFQVCFDVIGVLGEESPITFTNNPTPIEIGDPNQNPYGFVVQNGQVNVSDNVLFVNLTQDSVSCPSSADGSFTLSMSGGTPPYQFTWNSIPPGGANGPFIIPDANGSFEQPGLAAGLYEIQVNDSSNPANTMIDTVEVLAGPVLGVIVDAISPACFGESTGSITAGITLDGIPQPNPGSDLTFQWNTTQANTPTLTDIPFGFYAVTVTDGSGCQALASATLSQPQQLIVVPNNTFITDATCSGSEDGSITITATGGTSTTGNYTYRWDNGLGTVTAPMTQISNLNPGEYCVTVTDDNNCEFINCFMVEPVKRLVINPIITDVSCFGFTDGQVIANGSTFGPGESLPFAFSWSNTATPQVDDNRSSTISDLSAGTYIVTMTDSDPVGCEIIDTFRVVEPLPLELLVQEQTNETCVVGNDGSATIAVFGGNFPYTYSWSHDVNETDSIANNLAAGDYTLQVTDIRNCTNSINVTILAPTPPSISPISNTNVSCFNDTDGTLSVSATPGGAAIVGFSWSNGATDQTINNLGPGTYFVTVSAEDGCTSVDSAMVLAPEPLRLDSVLARSPNCPGESTGQLTVFIGGGTAPLSFTWSTNPSNPTTLNPLPALAAGQYGVTVQDANNCPALVVDTLTVQDPPSIVIDLTGMVAVSCPDDLTCDGQLTATAMYSDGSAGAFNFLWETSGEEFFDVTTSTAVQLCRGRQALTVSDGACGIIDSFEIMSPPEIELLIEAEKVSCNGLSDGSITLTPSGGTAPYDILWPQTGDMTTMISNLEAGVYNAIITDSRGCTKAQSVDLAEPAPLMLILNPLATTPSVTCNGDMDGMIAVTFNINDDINPVDASPFTWSGGVAAASDSSATNLGPGIYAVTITDVKGCQDSLSFTIGEPSAIVAQIIQPESPRCFGEPTLLFIDTIFGGNGSTLLDYTFEVDGSGLNFPPDQPATIFAGDHFVTVEDPAGCTSVVDFSVTQPAEIMVTLPDVVVVELGDTTVQLIPQIESSLPIDSFIWTPENFLSNPNIQSPFVIPEGDQDYTFTVVDQNGCEASANVFVELDANRNLYIPNVFSPNGIANEEFRIFGCLGVAMINSVIIFDRWGNLVFEANDLAPDCFAGTKLWDGRLNGSDMNSGVYVYAIEVTFADNVTLLYRGDVTLLR